MLTGILRQIKNIISRQEYCSGRAKMNMLTGILRQDKNIMLRQEYYLKARILSQDRNII
jgi:hypothetical protein